MSRIARAAILSLALGTGGGLLALAAPGAALEEHFGLSWLFALRGPIPSPPEAVVISINEEVAERLDHIDIDKLRDWKRSWHAQLIDRLIEHDVSAIVFDIFFEQSRDPAEDAALAQAIARSGRVVLFQHLQHKQLGDMEMHMLVDPNPTLAGASMGLAPFPLPKMPRRVNQFWTFYSGVGNAPTLPVTALQIYALRLCHYPDLIALLRRAGFEEAERLPAQLGGAGELRPLMDTLRTGFTRDATFVARFLDSLDTAEALSPEGRRVLRILAAAYASHASHYLNFYGIPGSVTTIPYDALLRKDGRLPVDLAGKAVFIGESRNSASMQLDGFLTVFSQDDGVDLSGVEIAATAFANLLAGHALRPHGMGASFAIVFAFGALVGSMAYLLPGARAIAAATAAGALYLGTAYALFAGQHLWTPVFIPLALQLPLALLLGLFWQYLTAHRERCRVSRALLYYVPEQVVQRLSPEGHPALIPEMVYGTCLVSDVQGYTTLSEVTAPKELAALNNEYFGLLGERIARRNGIMLDIVGDGMSCVWPALQPQKGARLDACLAALDILQAVEQFNTRHPDRPYPTRIGLHAGWVAMGNVGGGGHLEYAVIGNIINTTSRIEGLNKYLGTRLLAAEPVVSGLDELLLRPTGAFLLKGKADVLSIFQIMGRRSETMEAEETLCRRFAAALAVFDAGRWSEAAELFEALLAVYPQDGPARFYLQRCRQYCHRPPPPEHGAVIRLQGK